MLIFKTPDDYPNTVEIQGVGVLGAYGKGGIPVERAANVMTELMERDGSGRRLTLDDSNQPRPLTGSKLTAAAKAWAEEKSFIEVANLSEDKNEALRTAAGFLPELDASDAATAAQAYAERQGALPEPVNTTPEDMNLGWGQERTRSLPAAETSVPVPRSVPPEEEAKMREPAPRADVLPMEERTTVDGEGE